MLKYEKWISKNVKNPKAMCAEITQEMETIFPELTRVRGHYYDLLLNKKMEHWWLITLNGDIVDPTKKQFMGYGEYISWKEGSPEPTRKCMECGDYVYGGEYFCEECMRYRV